MAAAASRNAAEEKSPGTLAVRWHVGLVSGNKYALEIAMNFHFDAMIDKDFVSHFNIIHRFKRRCKSDFSVYLCHRASKH